MNFKWLKVDDKTHARIRRNANRVDRPMASYLRELFRPRLDGLRGELLK